MSDFRITVCDECNTPAPEEHSSMFPAPNWLHVAIGRRRSDNLDFCGWMCASAYATREATQAPTPKRTRAKVVPVLAIGAKGSRSEPTCDEWTRPQAAHRDTMRSLRAIR